MAEMWLKWNGIASFAATERRTALPYRGDEAFRPASRMREEGSGAVRATEWRNAAANTSWALGPHPLGGPISTRALPERSGARSGPDPDRLPSEARRRSDEARRPAFFGPRRCAILSRAQRRTPPHASLKPAERPRPLGTATLCGARSQQMRRSHSFSTTFQPPIPNTSDAEI